MTARVAAAAAAARRTLPGRVWSAMARPPTSWCGLAAAAVCSIHCRPGTSVEGGCQCDALAAAERHPQCGGRDGDRGTVRFRSKRMARGTITTISDRGHTWQRHLRPLLRERTLRLIFLMRVMTCRCVQRGSSVLASLWAKFTSAWAKNSVHSAASISLATTLASAAHVAASFVPPTTYRSRPAATAWLCHAAGHAPPFRSIIRSTRRCSRCALT